MSFCNVSLERIHPRLFDILIISPSLYFPIPYYTLPFKDALCLSNPQVHVASFPPYLENYFSI